MAVTESIAYTRREPTLTKQSVAASTKLYGGTLANFDSSKDVKAGSDTAGEVFAGITIEEVDNSTGSAGDKFVELYQTGIFLLKLQEGNAAKADIGIDVFVYDNEQVARAATTTNDVKAGIIIGYHSATYVPVRINVFG